jgi:hypothetical protein
MQGLSHFVSASCHRVVLALRPHFFFIQDFTVPEDATCMKSRSVTASVGSDVMGLVAHQSPSSSHMPHQACNLHGHENSKRPSHNNDNAVNHITR